MDNWLVHLQGFATLLAAVAAAIMTFINYLKQGEVKQEVKHLAEVEEQRMQQLQGFSPPAAPANLAPYPPHGDFPGAGGNL